MSSTRMTKGMLSQCSFSCHSSTFFLSSQCSDTGIQFSIRTAHFNITFILTNLIKFLDSIVTRWNDTLLPNS
ncbi:MAG: hypothetical protein LBU02_02970 [Rickettsiales bacterium]|nr:hypothetical protein [Rickettsiales bacterium]